MPEPATHLVRGKVLKLNDQLWEYDRHLLHELLHQLVHLLLRNPGVAQTEVERVLEELLVIGAHIDADRDRSSWADSIDAARIRVSGCEGGSKANKDSYPAPAT